MNPFNPAHVISKSLRAGSFSVHQLCEIFLQRIAKYEAKLNCFISLDTYQTLRQAKNIDESQNDNKNLLTTDLRGIPFSAKDLFCTRQFKTTCASRMLEDFAPSYDATVITQFRDAQAVLMGKNNMDEFAMGSTNENSYFGAVINPWDRKRVAGGSSGGAAATVAAGLAPLAIGSDTGGSIRQPAAFCGVCGIKPTYGSVSRYGMIAYASSLDQAGAFAHDARDLALMLNTMIAADPHDATSISRRQEDFAALLDQPIKGLRIGVPDEFFTSALDTSVADAFECAINQLEQLGAVRKNIHLPHFSHAIAAYYTIALAECASNLARYDGVRYGHRCLSPSDLTDLYTRSRAEGFSTEVKRRILLGTYVLSAGYYDAYYRKAQQVRRLICNDFRQAWQQVDVIAGPVTPTPACHLGEKKNDPVQMYLQDIYTVPVNLAGLPALSIPMGFVDQLPVGLHLIGAPFDEAKLLQVAQQYQNSTNFHMTYPPLFQ